VCRLYELDIRLSVAYMYYLSEMFNRIHCVFCLSIYPCIFLSLENIFVGVNVTFFSRFRWGYAKRF